MTATGRNDRSIQEFATVDWMAYQGAPDGGVAGKSRISQWWTGSQCKEVNLPQVIVYLCLFSGSAVGDLFWGGGCGGAGGGPKRGERSCHAAISNIHDYESYSVGSKSQSFDAAVGNCIIFSIAAILDCYCVWKVTDCDTITLFRYFAF